MADRKLKYQNQFKRTRINKIKRLEKELRVNPNNRVAAEALDQLRKEL